MSLTLDAQIVLDGLDRAVSDRGADYVDPGAAAGNTCQNFQDNMDPNASGPRWDDDSEVFKLRFDRVPSCIVGHIVHGLGLGGLIPSVSCASTSTVNRLREAGITVTYAAAELLTSAQMVQDGGGTWGEARNEAQRRYIAALREHLTDAGVSEYDD